MLTTSSTRFSILSTTLLLLSAPQLPAFGTQQTPDVAATVKVSQKAETSEPGSVKSSFKQKSHPVGYSVITNEYDYKDQKAPYKVALWYPSIKSNGKHIYKLGPSSVEAELSVDSELAPGKFPILFYSHGATGSGTSSFWVCELLAKHGYIVVAPDYLDIVNAARIDEPVAFDAFMRMKTNRDIQILREFGLNKAAKEGRSLFAYRPEQLKSTIDKMLAWNSDSQSKFFNHIDTERVGLFGHSFGAWTSLLLAGADSKFSDNRVKAVVALSGPVNEFVFKAESVNDLKAVHVPTLFEYGEQEPTHGRKDDKALLFDPANAPKILLAIKDADHLSFSGGIKGEHKLSREYFEKDEPRRIVAETTLDFFDAFLKDDKEKLQRLKSRTDGVSFSATQL